MKFIICFVLFCFLYSFFTRRFKNPYKLYLVFGKKGSGKSTYLVKLALKYQKKKYTVYTNMLDMQVPGVRLIDADQLGEFVPPPNSCVLLDEVGMIYDNRNYKNFKNSTRDFYKLQRHYKCVVYLASQTYDIDKKLRDLTDGMYLCQNLATVFTLVRPISKKITLTEATADGESRIAENLRFQFLTSWKINYIPKYVKYFQSFIAPELPSIEYTEVKHKPEKSK